MLRREISPGGFSQGRPDVARDVPASIKGALRDDFYLEIQDHRLPGKTGIVQRRDRAHRLPSWASS